MRQSFKQKVSIMLEQSDKMKDTVTTTQLLAGLYNALAAQVGHENRYIMKSNKVVLNSQEVISFPVEEEQDAPEDGEAQQTS